MDKLCALSGANISDSIPNNPPAADWVQKVTEGENHGDKFGEVDTTVETKLVTSEKIMTLTYKANLGDTTTSHCVAAA